MSDFLLPPDETSFWNWPKEDLFFKVDIEQDW